MPWSRKFAKPIALKDGRTIATLGEARALILSLPDLHQTTLHWQHAAKMISRAAEAKCGIDEGRMQMVLALKAEGLL
jgi:hypothetical protein